MFKCSGEIVDYLILHCQVGLPHGVWFWNGAGFNGRGGYDEEDTIQLKISKKEEKSKGLGSFHTSTHVDLAEGKE